METPVTCRLPPYAPDDLPAAVRGLPRAALLSRLGLGTVKFGRNTGVKYPGGDGFALPDDAQINTLLDLCLDLGVTVLDTAPAYGSSEERLGHLLAARRQKFFLCSKTGEDFDGAQSRYDFSAAHTRASVERSLARLKTDYLDAVLVHCNRDDEAILRHSDVIPALLRLRDEGKIGLIGASTYTVAGGLAALELADAVMVAHNSAYQDEAAVIAAAQRGGKAVFVKKALASGHSRDIAADLRFVAGTAGVTSAIIGSLTPANIRANVAALATDSLY